jgi:hypothetical protein
MTEGERAYYKRRIREELAKANAPENRDIRNLHLRWALLYQERLDGTPKYITRALEARMREAGFDFAQLVPSEDVAPQRGQNTPTRAGTSPLPPSQL